MALIPAGMSLWKGGLGESLPAEKWQQVSDFHREAVPDLLADHAQTFGGLPIHAGLRWARAAAVIEISEEMVNGQTEPPQARVVVSEGFASAPRLEIREGARSRRVENSLNLTNIGPGLGLVLEWRMDAPGPQHILYGSRARSPSGAIPGWMQPHDYGDGRGELWLGQIIPEGDDLPSRPTDELLNVGAVCVLIR